MPSKNPAQRLFDIVDNIDAKGGFTAGIDIQSFRADRRTVYAVVRALEIISEASKRLPTELLQRHPEIDWPAVAAAGNVYRYEYEAVDETLLWHTVQHDLGELRQVAETEFRHIQTKLPHQQN
ncbi:MAG: HepT-like ribonuclease domain-containing protein [Acidobacteriota bacterium]